MHGAVAVGHQRGAVEHHRVLAADQVQVDQGGTGFAGALGQQRIALGVLAALERRGIGHQHQLRAGSHGVGQRLGVPQVLAHDHPDRHALDFEHAHTAIRIDLEVAALVEHGVVGQLALAVGGLDPAIAQHAGGVVEHAAGRFGPADHGGDAVHARGDALQRGLAAGQERRPQQQVLRRVAAHGQLREQDDVGAVFVTGIHDQLGDPFGVAFHRADREIELGQCDPQAVAHAVLRFRIHGRQ